MGTPTSVNLANVGVVLLSRDSEGATILASSFVFQENFLVLIVPPKGCKAFHVKKL